MSIFQGQFSSVQQYIVLLKDSNNQIREAALQKLIQAVDSNWSQIADYLQDIDELSEDKTFSQKEAAAYLQSKIYYHLEELDLSLSQALRSGNYFNLDERSHYVESLVSKSINKYIEARQNPENEESRSIEQLYKPIVEKMLQKSVQAGELRQPLGIAIESQRIDVVCQILDSDNSPSRDLVNYLYEVSHQFVLNHQFKTELIQVVIQYLQKKNKEPRDYVQLSQCHFALSQSKEFADLLKNLVSTNNQALAYQICLDISENDSQYFYDQVENIWREDLEEAFQTEKHKLLQLLKGSFRENLNHKFLVNNYKSDPQVIQRIRNEFNFKVSLLHSSVIYSNSIFNAGTHNGNFLQENFTWVDKADNWARFSAVASLGVINKGNYSEALNILNKYLKASAAQLKGENELGGALYALGLIYTCNKDAEIMSLILTTMLENNDKPQVIHGSCLGLGLMGIASRDQSTVDQLKEQMLRGETVISEAAALGIGMLMAGSGDSQIVRELLEFGGETDREKIQISIGQAVSMIMFGQEDKAETVIEQMLHSQEASIRQGGVLTLGLAYVGTTRYKIIERLLHYSVEDVSDDVRRCSVLAIALVMFKQYEQLPKYMKLLSVSYNAHTRYGTAIALGIACAGTGFKEALDIIEPLLSDSIEFVQQGALIGQALILQQLSEKQEPRVEKLKKLIDEIIKNKTKNHLVKFGAVIAQGILEAGGRNQVVTLASSQGFPRLQSCIGVLVFSQFWYFYPRIHFLSLALQPQAIIGVTPKTQSSSSSEEFLRIPKSFKFQCNAKPSLFQYPPMLTSDDKNEEGDQEAAKLSMHERVTSKTKKKKRDGEPSLSQAKDNRSLSKQPSTKLEIIKRTKSKVEGEHSLKNNSNAAQTQEASNPTQQMEIELQNAPEKKQDQEPNSQVLTNPSRVLEKQRKFIQYIEGDRYKPLVPERKSGIILLIDSQPEQPEEYILEVIPKVPVVTEQSSAAQGQQQQVQQAQNQDIIQPPDDFVMD